MGHPSLSTGTGVGVTQTIGSSVGGIDSVAGAVPVDGLVGDGVGLGVLVWALVRDGRTERDKERNSKVQKCDKDKLVEIQDRKQNSKKVKDTLHRRFEKITEERSHNKSANDQLLIPNPDHTRSPPNP